MVLGHQQHCIVVVVACMWMCMHCRRHVVIDGTRPLTTMRCRRPGSGGGVGAAEQRGCSLCTHVVIVVSLVALGHRHHG